MRYLIEKFGRSVKKYRVVDSEWDNKIVCECAEFETAYWICNLLNNDND